MPLLQQSLLAVQLDPGSLQSPHVPFARQILSL
jgi:hypothetical protein